MIEREGARYASVVAKAISVLGEAPRARILAMLRALDLTEEQASWVVRHGLAVGLFIEEPGAATLRMPRQNPVEIHDERRKGDERIPTALEAERRLEILRLILESLPVVMWVLDAHGVFLHFEGQGVERMGLTEGQFVGQSYYELFGKHESAESVRRALEGKTTHSTLPFAGMDWDTWCFPIPDPDGRTKLIVFISIDVSESRRKEQELRDQLDLIERQQRMIRALSTPIIEVWDKVLTLPLFGVLDSQRSAEVMDSLLVRVSATGAQFAILDLTSVEGMDTHTASHILKLIRALRLLGAEGIITGIRPDVSRAMVGLEVDLEGIVTLATLRSALEFCMRSMRRDVHPRPA
jgi:rsbT co-antagonist protein RsbR